MSLGLTPPDATGNKPVEKVVEQPAVVIEQPVVEKPAEEELPPPEKKHTHAHTHAHTHTKHAAKHKKKGK